MNFSKKILIALTGASWATGLATTALLYRSVSEAREHEHAAQYRESVRVMADGFKALAAASDGVARNAAQVVLERYARSRKIPNHAQLVELRNRLGVARIEIIARNGEFVSSSADLLPPNLFALCADYRALFNHQSTPQQTPVIPEDAGTELYKYSLVPSPDRRLVVDVSMDFAFVTPLIRDLVNSDLNDLNRLEFLSPSGKRLGVVNHPGFTDLDLAAADFMQISYAVPVATDHCCECHAKQLASGSEPYAYHFVATVSLAGLKKDLNSLRWQFGGILSLIMVLSLFFSSWISRLLLVKIVRIRTVVDEIAASGNFSKRVPVDGPTTKNTPNSRTSARSHAPDELDALALQFNRMVAAVGDAQVKLLEARRAEAQASMAAQVAHDIRSPLTSMGMALGQLRSGEPSVGEALEVLKHGIDRVTGILKKLSVTYAKKSESVVETPRLILLDRLFQEVAAEHQLVLSVPHPRLWAVAQVSEIQSAVSNLLNNAREAVAPDTGRVWLALESDAAEVRLTVSDNGVGIPPENLERIFERKATFGKPSGTGLGLFQAKAAAEWSGGKLSVRSRVDEGSIFTLTLPLEPTPSWCACELSLAGVRKIIFVDDDPSMLQLWQAKTRGLMLESSYFSSAPELESVVWTAETVLVIDQYLGGAKKGLEVLAQLGLSTRGYLCTSEYDDPGIQAEVRRLGGYLVPKPWVEAFVFKV